MRFNISLGLKLRENLFFKREGLFELISSSLVGNLSAKAAIDMAIYDCLSKFVKIRYGTFGWIF